MKTSEVLQKIDIPYHKLYYLEQKGDIAPQRTPMEDLDALEYSPQDVVKVSLVWKFLKKEFKHKAAYQKALEELNSSYRRKGERQLP